MSRSWSELFPTGRTIFYEGDDPEGFALEIKEKFGFDVTSAPPPSAEPYASWTEPGGWSFHCPAVLLDEIYGTGKYRMGS